MWDNTQGTGIELVYVTMSLQRFCFLQHCLRFDYVRDRAKSKSVDK